MTFSRCFLPLAALILFCCCGPATAAEATRADVTRLLAAGKPADALASIDQLLRKTPQDAQLRFQRGVALTNLDRQTEASVVFEKLIEDRPDMAPAYNNLAVIEGARGDDEAARSLLTKAVQLKPGYPVARHNLGDVLLRLSLDAYAKAVKGDPTDAVAQARLAALRTLAGPAVVASGGALGAASRPASAVTPAAATSAPRAAASPLVAASTPRPAASAAITKTTVPAPVASVPDSASADVAAIVHSWADDWSRRDAAAYLGYYAPDFAGRAADHAAWERERKARLTAAQHIAVTLSNLAVSVSGNTAVARFRQSYVSDTTHADDEKSLTLVRTLGGRWLITRETVGR